MKMHLQKSLAVFLGQEKKDIDPLQVRFIDAYSTPFYEAFAWHFWNMAWNSMHEPEAAATAKKIPNWNKAKHDVVDYGILNMLWTSYMGPDFEMNDWILKSLKSIQPQKLQKLEQTLQALDKSLNEIRESAYIDKDAKSQLQASFLQDMKMNCLTVTEPSYSTLSEIKAFLSS
jgi:hypothetical protein